MLLSYLIVCNHATFLPTIIAKREPRWWRMIREEAPREDGGRWGAAMTLREKADSGDALWEAVDESIPRRVSSEWTQQLSRWDWEEDCDKECDHISPQTFNGGAWQSGTTCSGRVVETQQQHSAVSPSSVILPNIYLIRSKVLNRSFSLARILKHLI